MKRFLFSRTTATAKPVVLKKLRTNVVDKETEGDHTEWKQTGFESPTPEPYERQEGSNSVSEV